MFVLTELVNSILGATTIWFTTLGVIGAAYVGLKLTLASWCIFKAFVLPRIVGDGVDFKKMGEWAGTVICDRTVNTIVAMLGYP